MVVIFPGGPGGCNFPGGSSGCGFPGGSSGCGSLSYSFQGLVCYESKNIDYGL